MDSFSPIQHSYEDVIPRRKKIVSAAERFRLALEVNLLVLVEPFPIDVHTDIKNGIERVTLCATKKPLDTLLDLFGRIDLRTIQRGFEIM